MVWYSFYNYYSLVVPPKTTLKYYNYTIELNQPVILNCSVSAVPRPEFQWILADTEEPFPESSWNYSTYTNKTTTSTLNYTFVTADLNEYCMICVMCIATNCYGRSEHYFTLSLNSSENHCPLSTPSGTSDSHTEIVIIISSAVGVATVLVALYAAVFTAAGRGRHMGRLINIH